MEFFNQKEEVIDIKLTQYGKRLLAKGEFSPMYYAFFDKDIVYNSEFGGFTEPQNNAETRIKEETPRLKVQHNFIGVETQFHELKEIIRKEEKYTDVHIKEKLQDIENKYFALDSAVGNTRVGSLYNPAWEVKFYNQNLSSSASMITGSTTPNIKIPQLEGELEFVTFMSKDASLVEDAVTDFTVEVPSDQEELEGAPLEFEDGSIIALQQDFMLLGIDEKNTEFLHENFEIEVFMEETITGDQASTGMNDNQKTTKLIPLQFYPEDEEKRTELQEKGIYPDTNTNFVEYYFDILIDDAIPTTILCQNIGEDEKKSIYVRQIFTCDDDVDPNVYADIYEQDDIGEPCE
tara:strand:- start:3492 stop:4535 length:1044 start_codon:yes stop_codon:yes gene_type:complete